MSKKERKGFVKEFKEFISRGSIVDMAVGVIIGGAFGKIVTSLVNDIIMPLIGLAVGKIDFASLMFKIGETEIKYGAFIQTIVDFLIVAFCIFVVIQIFEKFKKKEVEKQNAFFANKASRSCTASTYSSTAIF